MSFVRDARSFGAAFLHLKTAGLKGENWCINFDTFPAQFSEGFWEKSQKTMENSFFGDFLGGNRYRDLSRPCFSTLLLKVVVATF